MSTESNTKEPKPDTPTETPANTPAGEGLASPFCCAPACITVQQEGLHFSSALNDDEDWTILDAVLIRVRNRQAAELYSRCLDAEDRLQRKN